MKEKEKPKIDYILSLSPFWVTVNRIMSDYRKIGGVCGQDDVVKYLELLRVKGELDLSHEGEILKCRRAS
jgi:hypothetical protein